MNEVHSEIRHIISERVSAVKKRDVEKATANYSSDVIVYDIVDPLEHHGIDSLKNRLKEWLSTLSEIADFEITNIEIKSSKDVAYCSSLNHIDAINTDGDKLNMWWRETTCYAKANGRWEITHTHSSVPFNPESGQPSIGLKPVSKDTNS